MEQIKAYGAGVAGAGFDAKTFFKKPTVLFRVFSCLLGGALWAAVNKGGWHKMGGSLHSQVCLFDSSSSTCSFGSALGFFALVAAAVFIAIDAKFEQITAVQTRKRAVLADLVVSGCFTVIFIIGFFTFWSKYSAFEIDEPFKGTLAKLSIFIAFLSILSWGGGAFFAWRRFEAGKQVDLNQGMEGSFGQISSDAQDGYGYGGGNQGIGHVENTSYQGSYQNAPPTQAPPPQMSMAQQMAQQQIQQMQGGAPQPQGQYAPIPGQFQQPPAAATNPFVNQGGYQY